MVRIGTGPTRSLFPHNGALLECEAAPGTRVETELGTAVTVPLTATTPCSWCGRAYSPADPSHPYAGEVTGQCGACTASGFLENEHNDNGHDYETAAAECPKCDPELKQLAGVA